MSYYVVTRKMSDDLEYVLSITELFHFTKRGATQLRNSLTKADNRYKGRAIMRKTAEKDGLI